MTEETNNNQYYKCPHCMCIFLTKADLQKHVNCFSDQKNDHEVFYKKTHGRVEYGYSEE